MIEPVIIGRATLYLGDCRDILPTLPKVDAVVTDPPYGIEDIVGAYGRSGLNISNDRTLEICHDGLRLAADLVDDGYVVTFYSPRLAHRFHLESTLNATHHGELCWDKRAPGMGGRGLRYQHESIAIYCRGAPADLGPIFSVLSHFRIGETHPHQKPVPLMRALLACAGGQTILDPFMGSGSTGVAALQMGRSFIGVESDTEHFGTACRRLREVAGEDPGPLFLEAANG